MPDLSPKGTHQYWQQYQDPMIYRVVAFLEGVETWILDGNPDLEATINRLGETLEEFGNVNLDKLEHEATFIEICNSISSARALMLLQAIDTAQPGSASKLLMHAEEISVDSNDAAGLFLRRNLVFERLRLLGRVFNPERMKCILAAIEGEDNE